MFKRNIQPILWAFFLLSTLIVNGQQDSLPPLRQEVPPPPPPRQEIIFKTVEEMPRFPACEEQSRASPGHSIFRSSFVFSTDQ